MLIRISRIILDLLLISALAFGFKSAIEFRSNVIGLLRFHHDLSSLDLTLILLPNVFFYTGLLLWLLTINWPYFGTGIFKRILSSLFVGILLFIDAFWSATFTMGGGQDLFAIYYLLTQFNLTTIEFTRFQILFLLTIIGVIALSIGYRLIYATPPSHLQKRAFIASLVLLALSFVPLTDKISQHLALNSAINLLRTANLSPNRADFFVSDLPNTEAITISQDKQPNIVLVYLESTRRDSLSFFNKSLERSTSVLDQLASEGLAFSNVHAITPLTIKSMVAINCGVAPYLNYPILESNYGVPNQCLAEILSQNGYQTLFMQSASVHYGNIYSLSKQLGFKEFYASEDFDLTNHKDVFLTGHDDRIMLKTNQEWLSKIDKPFFASYLTVGAHWPYTLFDENNKIRYQAAYQDDIPPAYREAYNNYLNAVHYQDEFIGLLLQQYRDAGHFDNTIFVFVGDHGTGFGEHIFSQRFNNLHQESIAVPLIIYAPGKIKTAQHRDELLHHANIPKILSNIIDGNDALVGINNKAVFASCWYWQWCIARTDGRYKFIHHFDSQADQLFDLENDPKEKHNIIAQHPELAAQFKTDTLNWYQQQLALYGDFFQQQDDNFHLRGHIAEVTPYH